MWNPSFCEQACQFLLDGGSQLRPIDICETIDHQFIDLQFEMRLHYCHPFISVFVNVFSSLLYSA